MKDLGTLMEIVTEMAEKNYDGHFTLYRFTTNYRASFATPGSRGDIQAAAEGNTMEEALFKLIQREIEKPGHSYDELETRLEGVFS
jgi:hypothetical protein